MERRKYQRMKFKIPAKINNHPAEIIDISSGGFRLALENIPLLDKDVLVTMKSGSQILDFTGDIRWREERLSFEPFRNEIGINIQRAPAYFNEFISDLTHHKDHQGILLFWILLVILLFTVAGFIIF